MLSAGLEKWVAGDRMGALTYFEDCLKAVSRPGALAGWGWGSRAMEAPFHSVADQGGTHWQAGQPAAP